MIRLILPLMLLLLSANVYAQESDDSGNANDNAQTGNLNNYNANSTVSSNNVTDTNTTTKNYNGAGSSSDIPATSAISPSYMSNGSETCLMGASGAVQTNWLGLSSGSYTVDHECNRRRDSKILSDLGMKVAAVARMCGNVEVWKSMFISGTPCPILSRGKLIVGKRAYLMMKTNPIVHIPDYQEDNNQDWYNTVLGIGESNGEDEDSDAQSVSERFRTG